MIFFSTLINFSWEINLSSSDNRLSDLSEWARKKNVTLKR